MKKFMTKCMIVILLLISQFVFAQDKITREQRKISAFTAIKASGIANVYLIKGSQEKVEIEVNDREFNDRLKIEVANNTLVIRMENMEKWNNRNKDIELKIYVTYNNLVSLEGSGATNFYADDEIKAAQFKLDLSGANNSKLNINADKITVETSGASNATLTGRANRLNISSSGASNVKAYELKAESVNAESSGVANIYVTAQDNLEVRASGLSNINYKGNAKVITREVSKMASVHKH